MRSGLSSCIGLVTLFHFFTLTNFFWMLVEGLYLYMLVVKTFSGDNIRFNIYVSIGWGKLPCVCVCVFGGVCVLGVCVISFHLLSAPQAVQRSLWSLGLWLKASLWATTAITCRR